MDGGVDTLFFFSFFCLSLLTSLIPPILGDGRFKLAAINLQILYYIKLFDAAAVVGGNKFVG